MYPPGEQTRVRVGRARRAALRRVSPRALRGRRDGRREALRARRAVRRRSSARRTTSSSRSSGAWRPISSFPWRSSAHPIVRESGRPRDELAQRVPVAHRARARALPVARASRRPTRAFARGERGAGELERLARAEVAARRRPIDYVERRRRGRARADRRRSERPSRSSRSRAASGTTRLIDNVVLGEDPTRA